MKRAELVRSLAGLSPFGSPDPSLEQVPTSPEVAAELLEAALAREDIVDRSALDLGCGTGTLAIGAALLGARRVVGVDIDPGAVAVARRNAEAAGVEVQFDIGEAGSATGKVDTVLMNPPFGAQRRHADRPFWDKALELATRGIYAFALADSRNFIEARALAAGVSIDLTRPVHWDLRRSFPHHKRAKVELPVDLWVLRRESRR
jgi:putative methylase